MNRKRFLQLGTGLSLGLPFMNLKSLAKLGGELPLSGRMPALFIGHGNPMNVITDNPFRKEWEKIGKELPAPAAILCVSAHWLTRGTAVTMSEKPRTIHDFGGFPPEMYRQQYPAPGATEMAQAAIDTVKYAAIQPDTQWGLDHGAWCVLKAMYPEANVPVFQLSIDYGRPAQYHYELARELAFLRSRGVLIIGSGNVVHNLGMMNPGGKAFDWAIEFDSFVQTHIAQNTPQPLIDFEKQGTLARMAHPTPDHYLPLLYVLGARDKDDEAAFFNTAMDMGSVSMTSVVLG